MGLIIFAFILFQMRIHDVKSALHSELADNPFQGLTDIALSSIQMQWGWIVLVMGCAMLLFSAYLKQRKPRRTTYFTLTAMIALFIAVNITSTNIQYSRYSSHAAKAKEAEAKQYVGSAIRGQQAFYIEKNEFSWQLSGLGLGVKDETTNYRYQITVADKEKSVILATPKVADLKSYVGGVFVTKMGSETTTDGILCKSDHPTQAPVDPPTLNGTQPQCASGSSVEGR